MFGQYFYKRKTRGLTRQSHSLPDSSNKFVTEPGLLVHCVSQLTQPSVPGVKCADRMALAF